MASGGLGPGTWDDETGANRIAQDSGCRGRVSCNARGFNLRGAQAQTTEIWTSITTAFTSTDYR